MAVPPDPLRWGPMPIPDTPTDFVDGLRSIVVNGDPEAQAGMAAHLYLANRSMDARAFVNADGEMLLVPQQGRLTVTTELGVLDVTPKGFKCVELAPGVTEEEVRTKTGAHVEFA